jgi:hypothetical protein
LKKKEKKPNRRETEKITNQTETQKTGGKNQTETKKPMKKPTEYKRKKGRKNQKTRSSLRRVAAPSPRATRVQSRGEGGARLIAE